MFEFLAAATRTQIVAPGTCEFALEFGLLARKQKHNVSRWSLLLDEGRHRFHRSVNVREESFESFAQIIQPRLAVGCREEAIFGAAATANEMHRTRAAIARERVAFIRAEFALLE
jgi:hypothetical protein